MIPFPTQHDPKTSWCLGFNGTYAALLANVYTGNLPIGALAYTTDLGDVRWSGTAWQMQAAVDGLVANSGGVQAGATPLTARINRIATCAAAGNSVLLPASVPGMQLTVINAGAFSANVFPNAGGTGTEKINALSANAAFALAATKTCQFICVTSGQWHTWPVVP